MYVACYDVLACLCFHFLWLIFCCFGCHKIRYCRCVCKCAKTVCPQVCRGEAQSLLNKELKKKTDWQTVLFSLKMSPLLREITDLSLKHTPLYTSNNDKMVLLLHARHPDLTPSNQQLMYRTKSLPYIFFILFF